MSLSRALAMSVPLDDDGPDYGADGKANAARPSIIRRIAGAWRGSAAREAPVVARVYSDATMFDLMHGRGQLSDAQHRAASKLFRMWTNAGRNPRMSASYGERVSGGVSVPDDLPSPLDTYRAAIRPFAGKYADLLEGVMLGRHPGTYALVDYQAALDDLVREWGLEDFEAGYDDA